MWKQGYSSMYSYKIPPSMSDIGFYIFTYPFQVAQHSIPPFCRGIGFTNSIERSVLTFMSISAFSNCLFSQYNEGFSYSVSFIFWWLWVLSVACFATHANKYYRNLHGTSSTPVFLPIVGSGVGCDKIHLLLIYDCCCR